MDHTHSELPPGDPTSEALLLVIDALRLAIKDNPQLREALAQFLAKLIPDPAEQTPREAISKVVDNSPPESMGIDQSIPNDMHDSNPDESGCSASTRLQGGDAYNCLPSKSVSSMLFAGGGGGVMVSPTAINALNKSALVIEHNQSLSRMFTTFLKYEGYVVRTAREGEDALRLYRDCAPFDVVLIDYGMPKKNGIDIALGILKQVPTQPMIITASEGLSEDEVPRPKELMHIPLLLDMSCSRLRKFLEKLQFWATREEVDRAIAALTDAELLRLQEFERMRGEDLLQEALLSTFERAEGGKNGRRWNKRVTFVTYLIGAMRSIASHRKHKCNGDLLEYDTVKCDADGEKFSLLENVAACDIAADQRLIMEETVNQILGMFKHDPVAVWVLQGWSEGMQKSEIMEEHELTEKQYQAAVKRIRVKLSRRNGGGGGEKHGR